MIFIGSGIFYGIEGGRYDYVDSLFTMTSAMTTTGLMSVDPSQLSIGSQVLIVIYIWLGSYVWNRYEIMHNLNISIPKYN